MYLAIDVGGSKTLLALFGASGRPEKTFQSPTPASFSQFKSMLQRNMHHLGLHELKAACAAIPGRIDHESGHVQGYGTLGWQSVPAKQELQQLLNCPTVVENDAKLAGLSEATLISRKYRRVLYVTIGTGIGTALIMDGQIDKGLADSEGGQIWLERNGQRIQWEDVASGRAIVERFGKKASEIDDPSTWQVIAADIADGLSDLVAVIQPEVIVVGGGVGAHFDKFGAAVNGLLAKQATDLVPMPPVIAAQRPEEAVIYGCYEYIRQNGM